jgi:PAS domain S-box-containing protein
LLLRYGGAVFAIAVATWARLLLDPLLGDRLPFITLMFAAWYGGVGPALLSLLLGALSAAYFILEPRDTFAVQQVEYQAGLVLFVIVGFVSLLLAEAMRGAQRRARRAEEPQRTHREQLQVTLNSIGDAVITTDSEGRVTFLNPVAQALTGWTQEEAGQAPLDLIFKIVNERTRQTVENPVAKVLREGKVVGLANHTVLIAQDGTERPIEDSAAPIQDKKGRTVGVVLIFRDVAEQRRAEQQIMDLNRDLNRKVAEFQTLLEVIPLGIAVADDPECKHIWTNPAMSRLLRMPLDANVSLSAPVEERPSFRVYENSRELSPDELPMQAVMATGQAVNGARHDLLLLVRDSPRRETTLAGSSSDQSNGRRSRGWPESWGRRGCGRRRGRARAAAGASPRSPDCGTPAIP